MNTKVLDRRVLDIMFCHDCLHLGEHPLSDPECWHPDVVKKELNLNPGGKYIPEDCPLTRLDDYCLCDNAVKYKWKNFVCPIHEGIREDLLYMNITFGEYVKKCYENNTILGGFNAKI